MLADGFVRAGQVAEQPGECADARNVPVRSNQKVRAVVALVQVNFPGFRCKGSERRRRFRKGYSGPRIGVGCALLLLHR